MNLVIDVGNSHTKAGLFENGQLIYFYETDSQKDLVAFTNQKRPAYVLICSVVKPPEVLRDLLANYTKKAFVLDYKLPLPIHNRYETPETLGMDRVAAVAGARALFPDKNCLVIDAGTCIKYDFIDYNGNFWGGMIAPGLQMRFQAMHKFTARLPLLEPSLESVELVGRNTEKAMQSGVLNGMTAEIEGVITKYKEKVPDLQVIMCGGDLPFFETQIKYPIFAAPRLVLSGLDSILQHNVFHKIN
jgi:type III pantothenate kinase